MLLRNIYILKTHKIRRMDEYHNSMEKDGLLNTINPNKIGFSGAPMQDQLEQLKAKIRLGASKVELGFWGKDKGSSQAPVPGFYGKDQRQAMRELAQINEVDLSTHASPNVGSVSGFSGQEGFSEKARQDAVDEIKRAIDFAADVTDGGAIVFHTNEFQTQVSTSATRDNERFKKEGKDVEFQGYSYKRKLTNPETGKEEYKTVTEADEANIFLANNKSGKLVSNIQKNMEIFGPGYEKDSVGNFIINPDGTLKVAEENIDPNSGIKKINKTPYTFDQFKRGLSGYIQQQKKIQQQKSPGSVDTDDEIVAKFIMKQNVEEQKNSAMGQLAYYSDAMDSLVSKKRQIEQAHQQKEINEEQRKSMIEGTEQSISHYKANIEQINKQMITQEYELKHIDTIKKVGLERSKESIAEMAMYARAKEKKIEQRLRKEGRKMEKHLYVAPENIFPQQFGAHPDELKEMVETSRERMAEKLMTNERLSKKEANKVASQHIRATFDVGHANTWRKYFQGTDQEFKSWLVGKMKMLKKADVLGHIHISDNFGYSDEHTDPGQGTAPLKEAVSMFQGEKDVDIVVETASQGDRSFIAALKEFGTPIYGMSRPTTSDPWDVITGSVFGHSNPPYFVVGQYAQDFTSSNVSKDNFSTWSGVRFE